CCIVEQRSLHPGVRMADSRKKAKSEDRQASPEGGSADIAWISAEIQTGNLEGAVLPGIDLTGVVLEGINASFADLSGACLVRSRLSEANLETAVLAVAT